MDSKEARELEEAFPGKLSWRWLNSFEDINELCATLEEVASRTYQRSLGAGFVNDEEHRQRFIMFAQCGRLRVQLLEIEGTVQAFWLGTIYNNVFHSHETAYNPALRNYEVGTQMFVRMVDELTREGV